MTILHVSDFYFNQSWFHWLRWRAPAHDLAVLSGGLLGATQSTPRGKQIAWLTQWLNEFPRPLWICSGAQDLEWDATSGRWTPAYWLRRLNNPHVWVDGAHGEFAGLSVRSFGHTTRPKGGRADIWISHVPPSGTLVAIGADARDEGDAELARAVRRDAPRLVLSGHIASPQHWRDRSDTTLFLNPGRSADAPFPNHILVDTDTLNSRFYSASGDNDEPNRHAAAPEPLAEPAGAGV